MPEDGSIEVKSIFSELEEEDFTLPDTGPSSNDQFEDYMEELSTSSLFLSSVKQPTNAKVLVSSPELDIGDEPFNEFGTTNLVTMAFPTIFSWWSKWSNKQCDIWWYFAKWSWLLCIETVALGQIWWIY